MAAQQRLTDRDRPIHADLSRGVTASSAAHSGSGRRRFECTQHCQASGVRQVLPEQPGPVRATPASAVQHRLHPVLLEQPDLVHNVKAQLRSRPLDQKTREGRARDYRTRLS
jgi:hypothetical protein